MIDVSLPLAFTAGVLSFLSPCVLPLVPFYLSYVSGASVGELRSGGLPGTRLKIMTGASGFVLGFSVVTILILGSLAGAFAEWFSAYQETITLLAGLLIILFGLHLVGVFKIGFLSREKRFEAGTSQKRGFFNALLLGFSFGAGWSPCIGPIVGSVIALAGSSGGFLNGVVLMIAYTAGLAVPFLLSALLISLFFSFFERMKNYLRVFEIVSGALLIVLGVLIASGLLTWLNFYLTELFPGLASFA